jgi:hypothetical protein
MIAAFFDADRCEMGEALHFDTPGVISFAKSTILLAGHGLY